MCFSNKNQKQNVAAGSRGYDNHKQQQHSSKKYVKNLQYANNVEANDLFVGTLSHGQQNGWNIVVQIGNRKVEFQVDTGPMQT